MSMQDRVKTVFGSTKGYGRVGSAGRVSGFGGAACNALILVAEEVDCLASEVALRNQ
jgi:hypothetical protein